MCTHFVLRSQVLVDMTYLSYLSSRLMLDCSLLQNFSANPSRPLLRFCSERVVDVHPLACHSRKG